MSKPQAKDPVVIRVWKGDPDDVFALFPTDPADNYGHFCTSYQHSANTAGRTTAIASQQPARHQREAPAALERVAAYRLPARVLKRASRHHHDKRLATTRGVA